MDVYKCGCIHFIVDKNVNDPSIHPSSLDKDLASNKNRKRE